MIDALLPDRAPAPSPKLNFFSHVGIVVADLDAAITRWTLSFGLIVIERFDVPTEGVRSAILSTGAGFDQQTCLELISPTDPDDLSRPIARRLATHGEGLYHLAFRTDDLSSTVNKLRLQQVRVLDTPPANLQMRAVVHPDSANGVLLELLAGLAPLTASSEATAEGKP